MTQHPTSPSPVRSSWPRQSFWRWVNDDMPMGAPGLLVCWLVLATVAAAFLTTDIGWSALCLGVLVIWIGYLRFTWRTAQRGRLEASALESDYDQARAALVAANAEVATYGPAGPQWSFRDCVRATRDMAFAVRRLMIVQENILANAQAARLMNVSSAIHARTRARLRACLEKAMAAVMEERRSCLLEITPSAEVRLAELDEVFDQLLAMCRAYGVAIPESWIEEVSRARDAA